MVFKFGISDLIYMVLLIIGEYIHLYQAEKRSKYVLRIAVCCFACLAVSAAIPVAVEGYYVWVNLYNGAVRAVLLALLLCSTMATYNVKFFMACNMCLFALVTYSCSVVWSRLACLVFDFAYPYNIVCSVLCVAVTYGIFFLFSRLRYKIRGFNVSKHIKTGIVYGGIVCALIITGSALTYTSVTAVELAIAFALVYFSLLLLSVFTTEKHLQDDYVVLSSMLEKEKRQYEVSKEYLDIINVKYHDLKHIVQCSRGAPVDSGELDKIEEALEVFDAQIKTGNSALDVVLTEKLRYCAKHNVKLTCMADGAAISFIAPSDIYSLFGNILDNAIEASLKLSAEERQIALTVHGEKGLIIIRSENCYNGELLSRGDRFVSTKSNKYLHGFGMTSIKMIAEKYGGWVHFSGDGKTFVALVTIPVHTLEPLKESAAKQSGQRP